MALSHKVEGVTDPAQTWREAPATMGIVVPAAPRYSQRIFDLVRALDDPSEPMAETCRRVGSAAERLGLTRPSYSHLRRFIKEERERQAAVRRLVDHVTSDLLAGRVPHPGRVLQRLDDAQR